MFGLNLERCRESGWSGRSKEANAHHDPIRRIPIAKVLDSRIRRLTFLPIEVSHFPKVCLDVRPGQPTVLESEFRYVGEASRQISRTLAVSAERQSPPAANIASSKAQTEMGQFVSTANPDCECLRFRCMCEQQIAIRGLERHKSSSEVCRIRGSRCGNHHHPTSTFSPEKDPGFLGFEADRRREVVTSD
jgi:hypothetical protein